MHGVQPVVYPTRTHDRGDRDICGIARDGAEFPTAVPAHSPQPDKCDWIQLTSDEWLKGEFIALYDDALEFDSEELEKLTPDWEDVRVLRTARAVQVRFKDQTQVTGRVVIDASTVRVLGDTEQQFPRAELVSIAPGEPRELSYWSGNITFGFNLRTGNNSDQVEANTVASARRRTVTTRVVLDYVANYNLTDEIAVTNNQRANGAMDWFVTARFFVRPIVAEYFRDPFQNFAHRWTAGVALGYQMVNTPRVSWEFNAGPAYQRTTFERVAAGESATESTAAVWAGTTYTNELTKDIDYTADYRFLVVKPEAGRYTHHFLTGLSIDSVGPLDVDFSFVWDRVQEPRPESSGVVPEKDDYRLIVGVGFDF